MILFNCIWVLFMQDEEINELSKMKSMYWRDSILMQITYCKMDVNVNRLARLQPSNKKVKRETN